MRRLTTLIGVTALATGAMAGSVAADSHQPDPHDHKITVPGTGENRQVGPKVCDWIEKRGATSPEDVPFWRGFVNFHYNVHQGQPDQIGRGSDTGSFDPLECGDRRY